MGKFKALVARLFPAFRDEVIEAARDHAERLIREGHNDLVSGAQRLERAVGAKLDALREADEEIEFHTQSAEDAQNRRQDLLVEVEKAQQLAADVKGFVVSATRRSDLVPTVTENDI